MAKVVEFQDKVLRKFLADILKKTKEVDSSSKKLGGLMGAVVFKDVIDHFKKESGPEGKWKAFNGNKWAESTTKRYKKLGKGNNMVLADTGFLRNSFTPKQFRSTSQGFLWFNAAKTRTGFPYAWAHDNDVDARTRLPRRTFMWLSPGAQDDLVKQIFKFMRL